MELLLGWPDKYLELTRTLLYPEFFNRIYCWSIELIEQEQIKPLKYMIIMRSEGKFLRHFKEAAPLAVSTFGSKIGHLTLRMILHSSSKKVGLVAHHYHHFVPAIYQWLLLSSDSSIPNINKNQNARGKERCQSTSGDHHQITLYGWAK